MDLGRAEAIEASDWGPIQRSCMESSKMPLSFACELGEVMQLTARLGFCGADLPDANKHRHHHTPGGQIQRTWVTCDEYMFVALLIGHVEMDADIIPFLDTSSNPTYTEHLDMPISNSSH